MNRIKIDIPAVTDEDENFKKEVKKRALQNEEILQLIDAYALQDEDIESGLVKIAQVLSDQAICASCQSLSQCAKKDQPGTRLVLYYDEYLGEIQNRYTFCAYRQKWKELLEHLSYSDIDSEVAREIFNKVRLFVMKSGDVKSHFKSVLTELTTVLTNSLFKENFIKGYYIISPNGNGRVILEYTLIKSLQKGFSTAYIDAPSLFIPLTDNVKSEARDVALETYALAKAVEVLLVDNLGVEPKNYKIRDQYLIPLLCERRKRGLLTVTASRLSIEGLCEMYQCKDKATRSFFIENFKSLLAQKEIIEPDLFESN